MAKGGIGKFPGYRGWKKKGDKSWKMVVNNVKVAEARVIKQGKNVEGHVKVNVGKVKKELNETFNSVIEATAWVNRQRRKISKMVFG